MAKKRTWLGAEKLARIKRLHDGGYNSQEIADRMGMNRGTIGKVIARNCQQRRIGPRAVPADFSLYGATETCAELMTRYRACLRTIRRWMAEKQIARPQRQYNRPPRQRPQEFDAVAHAMSVKQMRERWGASYHTVARWCAEISLPTPRAKPAAPVMPVIGWADRYYAEARQAA
jgi:transposase-like protein